jgi:hypothetical protein
MILKPGARLAIGLVAWLACANAGLLVRAQSQELTVSASFADKQSVTPLEQIELRLNRPLLSTEGKLAVFIGQTDVTTLLTAVGNTLSYTPKLLPLPLGETEVTVYLVSPNDEWREIARLPLRVSNPPPAAPPQDQPGPPSPPQPAEATQAPGAGKLKFTPALTLGFKSQAAESHFPAANRPERPTFADATLQGSLRTELTRGLLNSQTQFDLVGSSYQKEALRFGLLGKSAPQIDLSSYLMQFQAGKAKFSVGHIGYGANRHLINGFGSRGITLSFPINRRSDFSLAAMNGTSIVGWSNFFGLNRRKHQILTGTLGFEFLPERPGGLRLEAGALYGSLLPLSGFNQGNITDAERSRGLGLRLIATDKSQRLRLEGGLARSNFTNPADPLLEQGAPTVAVRARTSTARYLDVSYHLLQNLKLSQSKTANLTATFRHERVDPLYRSVAASTQSDMLQNQFELMGSIGELNATFSHQRFNNNLDDIPSILKTLTRRYVLVVNLPLVSILGQQAKPSPWLPRLSANFDRTHQFGKSFPVNSGFDNLSQVPDQVSNNLNFNAEWQWQQWRLGYRFNRSFQDNRQPGRERADLRNLTNGFTIGINPMPMLDLNFDVNAESAKNHQLIRTDRLLRIGTNINWRITQKSVLAATLSTAFAGDVAKTSRSRNAELDLLWSYQFGFAENGQNSLKKVKGQFFIRYANRYARLRDGAFGLSNLTKLQTLNTGLNFTFF